ncbi:hypothetical protein ACOMHN_037842 [Nucella lapillus]
MKLTVRLLQRTAKLLKHYSQFQPSPLSLETFVNFGASCSKCRNGASEAASFHFLQSELVVRLANIMTEITHLPNNLLRMPSVASIKGWYDLSFKELLEFVETSSPSENELKKFTDTLVHIRDRHSNVVETMAQGMIELQDSGDIDPKVAKSIQYFLDRFYMSRISIRMLISQHASLFSKQLSSNPRHIGCIDPQCNIREAVEDAYDNAKFLCEQYYQVTPGLHIECKNAEDRTSPDVDIMYIPSHLHHMLFELFKNAMRATVEHYREAADLPAIKVLICKGAEDVCIKMSDMGGGIVRSEGDLLFQYMYSTAPLPSHTELGQTPLAGYGYGLPISRLYARYLHGDLVLNAVEGHGTDASIYLKVHSDQASEVLPVYNSTASKVYTSDICVHDWSSQPNWSSISHQRRTHHSGSSQKSAHIDGSTPNNGSSCQSGNNHTAQKSAHNRFSQQSSDDNNHASQKSGDATSATSSSSVRETIPTQSI